VDRRGAAHGRPPPRDCPHHYRFAKDGETEEQFATRCAESLEQLILKEGPDTVAAFRSWFEEVAAKHRGEYDGWEASAKP